MERFRLRQWESRIHFANRGTIPIGGYGPKEVALLFLEQTIYQRKKRVDRQNNTQIGIEERSLVFLLKSNARACVLLSWGNVLRLLTSRSARSRALKLMVALAHHHVNVLSFNHRFTPKELTSLEGIFWVFGD